jgi:AraC family transcriptional regulator, ethanolamine operon transcriptional activator
MLKCKVERAMPSQVFNSFEAFFDANQHANIRAMVLTRPRRNWVLTNLVLRNLSIQWGQAEAKAVIEGAPRAGGISIFLPTRTSRAWSWNGCQFDEQSILVATPNDEFCLAADTPRSWCSLNVSKEELVGANGDLTTVIGSKRGFYQVPSQRIERFRSIVRQLDETVRRAPAALESTPGLKAAGEKLVREIRALLRPPAEAEPKFGRHVVPRREIIRTAMDFVDQHEGEYLSLEQLATSAGVSERTLRDAFRGYFGLSPVQYLNRRILHQVRKALTEADPAVTTVTEIATQFGIFQFGRLARDYRLLFGELPSETLRQRG